MPKRDPKPEASTLEKVCVLAILVFLACMGWEIPIYAIPGVNWAMWPNLADVATTGIILLAGYISYRRQQHSQDSRGFALSLLIFGVFSTLSFVASWARYDLPTTQFYYLGYNLYKLLSAFSVWRVAVVAGRVQGTRDRALRLISVVGCIVGIACIMQQYDLLDYRILVAHLPADPGVSGPWGARVSSSIDAALGTLNYNRIYTAVFLATILIIAISIKPPSILSACIGGLLIWGIFLTQSRSVTLFVGASLAYLVCKRAHSRLRLVAALMFVCIGTAVFSYVWSDAFETGAITLREETTSESFSGRWERQSEGALAHINDPWTWIFGLGLGNLGFFWLGQGFSPAHGQYATVLAEDGIVGLMLFLRMYYKLFCSMKGEDRWVLGIKAVFIGVLANAAFNDLLLPSPSFSSFLGFFYCLVGLSSSAPTENGYELVAATNAKCCQPISGENGMNV